MIRSRPERGATATEYALLIAGIAAIVVAAILLFGGFVDGLLGQSCDTVAAESGGSC
ncbi:Flp family type IVb pilin [Nocardioides perillae]|uniref:Pilus assembly protein Flp/PilA n=1 Tax=Nocardioides perillae TaxID=1119534 RepID=A0A7Y9RVW1_9ACTN|nr:Flp family type IVb pilin [Nocardioides perillae]NYG56296.1 pilus assembly protein Flp/PilA [Nocardioides perillae]